MPKDKMGNGASRSALKMALSTSSSRTERLALAAPAGAANGKLGSVMIMGVDRTMPGASQPESRMASNISSFKIQFFVGVLKGGIGIQTITLSLIQTNARASALRQSHSEMCHQVSTKSP